MSKVGAFSDGGTVRMAWVRWCLVGPRIFVAAQSLNTSTMLVQLNLKIQPFPTYPSQTLGRTFKLSRWPCKAAGAAMSYHTEQNTSKTSKFLKVFRCF